MKLCLAVLQSSFSLAISIYNTVSFRLIFGKSLIHHHNPGIHSCRKHIFSTDWICIWIHFFFVTLRLIIDLSSRQVWSFVKASILNCTVKCKGLVGLHQSKSHYSGQALFRISMRGSLVFDFCILKCLAVSLRHSAIFLDLVSNRDSTGKIQSALLAWETQAASNKEKAGNQHGFEA